MLKKIHPSWRKKENKIVNLQIENTRKPFLTKTSPTMYIEKYFKSCLAAILLAATATAQNTVNDLFGNKTEIVFSFEESNSEKISELSRIISIDNRRGSEITAYANAEEFAEFLREGYRYTVLEKNCDKALTMASSVADMAGWDRYPTYGVYLQMMQDFATSYPDLCRIDTIGTSVDGRLILCAKIADSVNTDPNEPQLLFNSTIHGDEITGYILMLRLIDHLLSNYGTDAEITKLVNTTQIYINPLLNPDGTYAGGDSTVSGATRYNANRKDLNRNYPDHWSTSPLSSVQRENTAMMNFAGNHHFVLAGTLHGGSEIFNFPWDSFESSERRIADYNWWVQAGLNFADTCRKYGGNSHYTSNDTRGYTAGGDWYVIHNGQQDYMTFYHRMRIVTIEVSTSKKLATSKLNTYWNMHERALINFMKEIHKGIKGMVVDSVTRQPLEAMLSIENHDYDSSEIFSRPQGDFYRLLLPGTYTMTATAPGYRPKTMTITVGNDTATNVVFELSDGNGGTQGLGDARKSEKAKLSPNPCQKHLDISGDGMTGYRIFNALGASLSQKDFPTRASVRIDVSGLPKGLYIVEILKQDSPKEIRKFVKK